MIDFWVVMVYVVNVFDFDWRGVVFWCCFYWVVFYFYVDLDVLILLYIWVFVFGIFDIVGDLCGDYGCIVLFLVV